MRKCFRIMSVVAVVTTALFLNSCKPKDNPLDHPADLDVNNDELVVSASGERVVISLYSNRDWTIKIVPESAQEWVKVSPSKGVASLDSVKVEISVSPNDGYKREAEVVFTNGIKNEGVEISQEGTLEDNFTSISKVRDYFKGDPIEVVEDWIIKGIVISDYRKNTDGGLYNATSAKCVILSDDDAGIQLRLTEDNKDFAKGDEITVALKGLTLQRYQNGSIQVNNVPIANVTKVGENKTVEPITITAEELLSGDYESMYVAVKDVQTKNTGDILFVSSSSHTSVPFVSKDGQAFDLFSSKYSTFGSQKVPTGSGVLKGIATLYNSAYQISITSIDDCAGLTGQRFSVNIDTKSKVIGEYSKWKTKGPLTSFLDTFTESKGDGKGYENDYWMFYTNDGSSNNYCFKTTTYSNNKYLDIAPYNSSSDQVVSYALLPPLNLKQASPCDVNVKVAYYYQNQDNSKLEVVISDNFEGDFEKANWKVVKDISFANNGKTNTWELRQVSLDSYKSSITTAAVAIRYTGKENTYRIDNVSFGYQPDPESYQAPTPVTEIVSDNSDNKWMELPEVTTTSTKPFISHHTFTNQKSLRNYSMLYDTENRVALWTAYHISSSSFGPNSRTDAWEYDPKIPKKYQPNLYRGWGVDGYDRGHVVPSASRTTSYEYNAKTFFFSNMTVQNSKLNQGVWGKLEDKVRSYVSSCDTVYVVVGSVLKTAAKPEIEYITDREGKQVAKPQAYFKIVMKYTIEGEKYEAIAFWYENREYENSSPVAADTKSVTWVEEQTGYTFFRDLPSAIKKSVKDAHEPSRWGL